MPYFNYQKTCLDFLKDLPQRTKEVVSRRFGLETGKRETLEAIGKDLGVTRERVRQIEEDGFSRIKPKLGQNQKVFQYFIERIKSFGGLKKETLLLENLGEKQSQAQVCFLLTLSPDFKRAGETDELYPFWTLNQNSLALAKKVISSFYQELKKTNHPLTINDFTSPSALNKTALVSCLEVSKIIQKGPEGLFGLKSWPEINPRGVKDKAFLVFKKEKNPLHFNKVAELIGEVLPQTVHNELIRDDRFVLVGRGMYALREWGYEPGYIKDVISKILKEANGPLAKEEVLKKVLEQRLVKENTVLLNLSNKKYFLRDSQGYTVKKA